jgi:hypothetical protein
MKRSVLILATLLLSGCNSLANIPSMPEQTPADWLRNQPYLIVSLGSVRFVLVQPSSTVFVYLLGILTIAAGLYFLRIHAGYRSRQWWGLALLLWGVGALLAGTSYQAFSYEIKCAGRAICSWTSWWEVLYLLCSAASINAMVVAIAYSSSQGKPRAWLMLYTGLNLSAYSAAVVTGAVTLNRFLISFELLLLAAAPSILALFFLNGWRFIRLKEKREQALMVTWIWLGVVIAAYALYSALGISNTLWSRGIWFTENDVLHIGLISWMGYLGFYVARQVVDQELPTKRKAV